MDWLKTKLQETGVSQKLEKIAPAASVANAKSLMSSISDSFARKGGSNQVSIFPTPSSGGFHSPYIGLVSLRTWLRRDGRAEEWA